MSEMSFSHFSHIEHPLGLYSIPEEQICQMCNLPFPDHVGYACSWTDCFHFIHKNCAEFPQQITTHSLHNHSLTLAKTASIRSTSSCCHYCDKPISVKEYAYACEQCPNFRMHMACAMIPLPIMQDGQGGDAGYECHGNPMKLVPHDEFRKGEAKCFACQTPWDGGSAYSCASSTCENFFHKSCGEQPRKIRHSFHRRHALTLQVSKPRSCDSCCKKECRLIFCCFEEGCNLSLGLECACYSHAFVNYQSHDHPLALVEKASCDDIHCDACRKSYKKLSVDQILVPKEVDRTRSLLFRCMECSYNLHFLCGPLPFRVKYEYHIHPLTIVDHSTVEDTGSDEFYCDACEEERDQNLRFYYCADCKYSAHIHCVLTEIMKVIKEDSKDVDLRAFGEHRWVSEKELKDDHKTNTTKSTSRDIMDRLTESEKKMLINPYHDSYPYTHDFRVYAHQSYAQRNTCLDREGSVEDIIRAPQIFNFHVAHFLDFFGELSCFSPAGGLKLDDNYLRQEVQDVKGYMVPKTLVRVLETLLNKYGDLGEDSSLSPAMKSVGSTLLCAAVERMYRTRVEDITRDDLRHLFFNLQGVDKIANFEATMGYLDDLTAHIMPAFLGLEAMRYKKDMRQKLDHKIATLEAELKTWKENRKMLDKCEAEASDFMKMCWAKASKWGRKYCGEIWL